MIQRWEQKPANAKQERLQPASFLDHLESKQGRLMSHDKDSSPAFGTGMMTTGTLAGRGGTNGKRLCIFCTAGAAVRAGNAQVSCQLVL